MIMNKQKNRVHVTDGGFITCNHGSDKVVITAYDCIRHVHGDIYTDANGIDIRLRRLLNEMMLTQAQVSTIRTAPLSMGDIDTPPFDARTRVFLQILANRLSGVIDMSKRQA
jgi:hypothetical protein